jgi:hypothetical protein
VPASGGVDVDSDEPQHAEEQVGLRAHRLDALRRQPGALAHEQSLLHAKRTPLAHLEGEAIPVDPCQNHGDHRGEYQTEHYEEAADHRLYVLDNRTEGEQAAGYRREE